MSKQWSGPSTLGGKRNDASRGSLANLLLVVAQDAYMFGDFN